MRSSASFNRISSRRSIVCVFEKILYRIMNPFSMVAKGVAGAAVSAVSAVSAVVEGAEGAAFAEGTAAAAVVEGSSVLEEMAWNIWFTSRVRISYTVVAGIDFLTCFEAFEVSLVEHLARTAGR